MTLSDQQQKQLNELIEFLKIPSISANSNYTNDVRLAAKWVADSLQEIGCQEVEVINTPGHPVVYGELMVDNSLPTVLVYGHYDVQPPDPVALWDSPLLIRLSRLQKFTQKAHSSQEVPVTTKDNFLCM